MRSAVPLLALLVVLSACAPINGRPNGWGLPGDLAPGPRTGDSSDSEDSRRDEPPARPPVAANTSTEARDAERTAASSSALLLPVVDVEPGHLRDSFHTPRSGGRTHHAIDIAAPRGTPVVAVTDGTIVRRHWNRLGGNTLYLRSADGRYDYYYAHLDRYADGVEAGTAVQRGDVLGTVGDTGNARTPHLHFQVLERRGDGRGTPVNPYRLLQSADVALAP